MSKNERILTLDASKLEFDRIQMVDDSPEIPQDLLVELYKKLEERLRNKRIIYYGSLFSASDCILICDSFIHEYSIAEVVPSGGQVIMSYLQKVWNGRQQEVSLRSVRVYDGGRHSLGNFHIDLIGNELSARKALGNMETWIPIAEQTYNWNKSLGGGGLQWKATGD